MIEVASIASTRLSILELCSSVTYLEAEKENAHFKREDATIDVITQEQKIGTAKDTNFKMNADEMSRYEATYAGMPLGSTTFSNI